MAFHAKTLASDGARRLTGVIAGSFVTAGAGAPTGLGGDVVAVARLATDAGANFFFRVTLRNRAAYHDVKSAVQATPYLDEAAKALFGAPHVGSITADAPAVAIDLQTQVDIALKDAAGAYIDTSGIRINIAGVVAVG